MTINQMAAQYDEAIEQIQAAPMLNFPKFLTLHATTVAARESSGDSAPKVRDLYRKYGVFFSRIMPVN